MGYGKILFIIFLIKTVKLGYLIVHLLSYTFVGVHKRPYRKMHVKGSKSSACLSFEKKKHAY